MRCSREGHWRHRVALCSRFGGRGRPKKRRGGRVGFVLVEAPGLTRTGCAVAEGDLRAAIEELMR